MTSPALPPWIMTSDPHSFARHTIEERKPVIIDRILADDDFPVEVQNELLAFKHELQHGSVSPLREDTSDRPLWDHDLKNWIGHSWLDIPWMVAEAYFYRRILEIIRYFQPGPWSGRDPYKRMKQKELEDALLVFNREYPESDPALSFEAFQWHINKALWGNRSDLSNIKTFKDDMGSQLERIIRNDTNAAFAYLQVEPGAIAYCFDNGGKELLFDLALIDYLLNTNLAKRITCYCKNQPFFVSDVMPADLDQALSRLAGSDSRAEKSLAHRLAAAHQAGRIRIEAPPFLTTSRMFRQLPPVLSGQLQSHHLTILKGDANYRRLVGDRHWPPTTPVGRAAGYFPSSFLSLRTLKAELLVGISPQVLQKIEEEAEPDWLINGDRGVITFFEKKSRPLPAA